MPFLAVAIIWLWENLQPGKEGRSSSAGRCWSAFLAVLSHPLLDL